MIPSIHAPLPAFLTQARSQPVLWQPNTSTTISTLGITKIDCRPSVGHRRCKHLTSAFNRARGSGWATDSLGAGNVFRRFWLRGGRTNRRHRRWKWLSRKTRPQFPWAARQALLTRPPSAPASTHVGAGGQEGHARLGQRLSADTGLDVPPSRGTVGLATKLGAGCPASGGSPTASVCSATTLAAKAPRNPSEVARHNASAAGQRCRSVTRREWGSPRSIPSLQAGSMCWRHAFTAGSLVEPPRQSHQCGWA